MDLDSRWAWLSNREAYNQDQEEEEDTEDYIEPVMTHRERSMQYVTGCIHYLADFARSNHRPLAMEKGFKAFLVLVAAFLRWLYDKPVSNIDYQLLLFVFTFYLTRFSIIALVDEMRDYDD